MRIGNLVMLIGGVVVAIGIVLRFAPGAFSWFGNLPGDIKIEGENSRVFIPLTSMILISIALTLIINVLSGLFRDR